MTQIPADELKRLQQQARDMVSAVEDDPQGRLKLREDFYQKYGFPTLEHKGKAGFGNSELDFLRWEIKRGVLNPLDAPQPGSPWWRKVNADFLYQSTLAGLIADQFPDTTDTPIDTGLWLPYIRKPGSQTWYRAHNNSIVGGYLRRIPEALRESWAEQQFMNIVLYRVLYAQAMVEGASFALGELGRVLANPKLPAVDLLVEIPDFYPQHYPLSPQDIQNILGKGHHLIDIVVDILDEAFILPNLDELYRRTAQWNQQPALRTLEYRGTPVYPNPHPVVPEDDDNSWLAYLQRMAHWVLQFLRKWVLGKN